MKKGGIILIGGGGHCKSVADVIECEGKYEILGVLDKPEKIGERIGDHEIVGSDSDIEFWIKKRMSFLVTIGHIKTAEPRRRVFEYLKSVNAIVPVIISPLAYVSSRAEIGEGSVIMHHALVNTGVKIGANCIINNKALLEHDSIVGQNCHISTGAIVNGDCTISDSTFVGSGSVIRQGINIGANSIIGAGAVVVDHFPAHSTIKGNPAN